MATNTVEELELSYRLLAEQSDLFDWNVQRRAELNLLWDVWRSQYYAAGRPKLFARE